MFHWIPYHPLSPQIQNHRTLELNETSEISPPTPISIKETEARGDIGPRSKTSRANCHTVARELSNATRLVPRNVSAHARVYKIDLKMQIGYIQFYPTVLKI